MTSFATRIITAQHPDYPVAARAMSHPPDKLYLKGAWPSGPCIAVVGTRAANDGATHFARALARDLASAGVVVWSGGAAGIDAAAHAGALEAGAPTVVVMGTGMAHAYPAEHRDLFEDVLRAGGAWLSPFADDQPGARWTFLARNQLLASLVIGVVLVQAPLRSGACSTAAAARHMGRRLWAVPHAPWDRIGAGCNHQLQLGAEPLTTIDPVLQACGIRPALRPPPRIGSSRPSAPRDLSEPERAVVQALQGQDLNSDELCARTGLGAGQVAAALLTLTLRHVLVEGSDGRYRFLT